MWTTITSETKSAVGYPYYDALNLFLLMTVFYVVFYAVFYAT